MLLRWSALSALLLAGVASASKKKSFECEFEGDLHHHFDLHKLAGEKVITNRRSTPPSTTIDELRFDLCAPLVPKANVHEGDQCAHGTRACLIQKNEKPDQIVRVISAIPLFDDDDLLPDYHELEHEDGVSILFHGSLYPPHPEKHQRQIRQYFNLTLFCEPDGNSDPELIHYDSVTGEAHIEWYTVAGCAKEWKGHGHKAAHPPPPHHEEDRHEPVHHGDSHHDSHRDSHRDSHHDSYHDSHHYDDDDDEHWNHLDYDHDIPENGHGGFFFVCFLIVAAYLGIGAWYNHKNHGARGWDLVPHRTFWREVPGMTKGLANYAYTKARPKSDSHSRSGSFHEV